MLEEGSAHRGQQPFKRLPTTSHHYHPNTKGPGQWPAYCWLNTSQTPILALDRRECGTVPWAPLPLSSKTSSVVWYPIHTWTALGEGLSIKE